MGPGEAPHVQNRVLEWDPVKNRLYRAKHGISFADAVQIFAGRVIIIPDDREDYGEDRWIAFGLLHPNVMAIVFTVPDERTIRIISARKAVRFEQQLFFESF